MHRRSYLALLFILSACGSSGSGNNSNPPPSDTKPVLADVTTDVILPTYRTLDTDAGNLRDAAEALRTAPSADALAKTQTAWRAARKAWRKSDAFRFGPVEAKEITAAVDYWPARPATIDSIINGADAITPESFDKLGANVKGFMALEYLLFDNAGAGDAGILAKLTTEAGAERRRLYVATAAGNLKAKTAELYKSWDPAGENFAAELSNAGSSSASYPSAKSAIDQLVNKAVVAGDTVAGNKIAKPFGKRSGGVVQPDQEETPRSDNSLADMLATLEGVQAVYDGTNGKGITTLVKAKNAALDDRMHAALTDAQAKVQAVPAPFRTSLTGQAAAVDASYEAVRGMKNLMGTEVAGALGTALQFNDNDGD
ncbi:imelysin family protein [Pendulispora rubella]|uniref:Imelysin family protein n=1 Tax=Pendulispora rubella TaxID=2741070 RepID=A0ABZ2LAG8_9BACT